MQLVEVAKLLLPMMMTTLVRGYFFFNFYQFKSLDWLFCLQHGYIILVTLIVIFFSDTVEAITEFKAVSNQFGLVYQCFLLDH